MAETDRLQHSGFSDIMSDKLFIRFKEFIETNLGIRMPDAKKTMLQARLQKRMRKLGIESFEDYYQYVFSKKGRESELHHMIDVVTTNKTDFFREPRHFDYLYHVVLPEIVYRLKKGVDRRVKVWSAGCSTGEEAYTLAMVLSEFANKCEGFNFWILATDISTHVLNKAETGIYEEDRIEAIPLYLRKKYLLRSKDKSKRLVRIVPELRNHVRFERLNLMDRHYNIPELMDIIFFRNVLIYFDRTIQEQVLNRMSSYLIPGGYLFVGHSETLSGLNIPLVQDSATVYRKIKR